MKLVVFIIRFWCILLIKTGWSINSFWLLKLLKQVWRAWLLVNWQYLTHWCWESVVSLNFQYKIILKKQEYCRLWLLPTSSDCHLMSGTMSWYKGQYLVWNLVKPFLFVQYTSQYTSFQGKQSVWKLAFEDVHFAFVCKGRKDQTRPDCLFVVRWAASYCSAQLTKIQALVSLYCQMWMSLSNYWVRCSSIFIKMHKRGYFS